jgi:hypothetical protein
MQCHVNMSALFVLTKRKAFATYRWHTYSRWQFALNPMVNSSDTTYDIWLVYL